MTNHLHILVPYYVFDISRKNILQKIFKKKTLKQRLCNQVMEAEAIHKTGACISQGKRLAKLQYLDVLHGRLLGSHVNFHWQLGGHNNHQSCSSNDISQGSSDFSLVSKVPQVKNRLFPSKHLPLCKPIRFAS